MKKYLILAVVFLGLLGLSVCLLKKWNSEDNEEYEMLASKVEDCNEYVLDKYMQPYWNGDVVYNESVMPLKNEEGEMEPITLMYDIGAIVSVKNSRLNTVYEEGTDYILEDGKLKILDSGSIPTIEYDYMYPTVQFATMNPDNVQHHRTKGYMYFAEGSTFHYMQLAVTYVPKGSWEGPIPMSKADQLPKTMEKLQNGEELKLVVYGDSISVGANSSKFVNSAPYCENYFEMLVHTLENKYNSKITLINSSKGSITSSWGVENAQELVADNKPDLVIIAFGMNDGSNGTNTIAFQNNINKIMEIVRGDNPDCEFVLVAPMLQNVDWPTAAMQNLYIESLNELETTGCAVADITSVHEYLLTRKRYMDMTGNHVNHPNDFLVRLYAQIINTMFQTGE